jgi:hypothetical protein
LRVFAAFFLAAGFFLAIARTSLVWLTIQSIVVTREEEATEERSYLQTE